MSYRCKWWPRAAAVLVVTLIVGTGALAAPRSTTLTLVTVMPGPDRDALIRSMLQEFEAKHPDIKVNHISLPWE